MPFPPSLTRNKGQGQCCRFFQREGSIYTSHELWNDSTFGMLPWKKSLSLERLSSFPFLLAPWVLAISQDENQGRSPNTNVDRERFIELVHTETSRVNEKKWVVSRGRLRQSFEREQGRKRTVFRHVEAEVSWSLLSVLHASLCLTCLISILNLCSLEWFFSIKINKVSHSRHLWVWLCMWSQWGSSLALVCGSLWLVTLGSLMLIGLPRASVLWGTYLLSAGSCLFNLIDFIAGSCFPVSSSCSYEYFLHCLLVEEVVKQQES